MRGRETCGGFGEPPSVKKNKSECLSSLRLVKRYCLISICDSHPEIWMTIVKCIVYDSLSPLAGIALIHIYFANEAVGMACVSDWCGLVSPKCNEPRDPQSFDDRGIYAEHQQADCYSKALQTVVMLQTVCNAQHLQSTVILKCRI